MQHLGLLTLALLIIGLWFVVTKWPGGMHMTFSQHAAKNRSSKIFYALLFLITLPLLMLFFSAWLVPEKNLPASFLWFAWVAIAFQIVCTWVPEEGGTKTIVHRILTGISGIALLPLVAIISISPGISTFARTVAIIALLVMTALLGIALRNQKQYKRALLLQIGYYAAFFLAIVAATYL